MRMPSLCLLLLAACCASAADAPLPPAAETALAKYAEAVSAADKEAFAKKQKAQAEALKTLDKLQQEATKAGNLDTALALRKQREALAQDQQSDLLVAGDAPTTAAEWDKLQGRVVKVLATQPLELTELPPGLAFRIVPHPADTWQGGSAQPTVGYRGIVGSLSLNLLPQMAMLVSQGGKDQLVDPLATLHSDTKVMLHCNDLIPGDNLGAIRVKIVAVKP